MAYITSANLNKIIYESDISDLNLVGEIYKIPIYFFSKYEENALLAIQELLKDPTNYFNAIYKPYVAKDTFRMVYEGKAPSYHNSSKCDRLKANYRNFQIPEEIIERGKDAVIEFRKWFETEKELLDKPDAFAMRIMAKYSIRTNPKAINHENSGYTEFENASIEDLTKKIDSLIKDAGRFYYKSEKNTSILKKFSKKTFYANRKDKIEDNITGYSDDVVRLLLKEYELLFKKPLKKYLIEYYRLRLNPEIKLEGEVLEALGFKKCGHCKFDDISSIWGSDFRGNIWTSDNNSNNSKIPEQDDLPF